MNEADTREMYRLLRTHKASPEEEAHLDRLLKQRGRERVKELKQTRASQAGGTQGKGGKVPDRPQRAPR